MSGEDEEQPGQTFSSVECAGFAMANMPRPSTWPRSFSRKLSAVVLPPRGSTLVAVVGQDNGDEHDEDLDSGHDYDRHSSAITARVAPREGQVIRSKFESLVLHLDSIAFRNTTTPPQLRSTLPSLPRSMRHPLQDCDNLADGSERDSPWSCGGGSGSGRRRLTSIIEHLRTSKSRLHNGYIGKIQVGGEEETKLTFRKFCRGLYNVSFWWGEDDHWPLDQFLVTVGMSQLFLDFEIGLRLLAKSF
ncbi:hypothetical protein WN48_06123 [Eufriesea mexicana]|nr:hypothetical protein WN48_06123 [Eufriesea mexicana]